MGLSRFTSASRRESARFRNFQNSTEKRIWVPKKHITCNGLRRWVPRPVLWKTNVPKTNLQGQEPTCAPTGFNSVQPPPKKKHSMGIASLSHIFWRGQNVSLPDDNQVTKKKKKLTSCSSGWRSMASPTNAGWLISSVASPVVISTSFSNTSLTCPTCLFGSSRTFLSLLCYENIKEENKIVKKKKLEMRIRET